MDKQNEIPEDCLPKISKLIKWCWNQNPAGRPDIDQAAKVLEGKEVSLAEDPDPGLNPASTGYDDNTKTQAGDRSFQGNLGSGW